MLAGGLRKGELCVFYGTVEAGVGGVRRHLPDVVGHCARYTGAVLYVPLIEVATGALREVQRRLDKAKAYPIRALGTRLRDMEDIAEQADRYAQRDDIRLMVIDPFEAIIPDRTPDQADPDADPEDEETAEAEAAQVSRDLKALARSIHAPIVLTCVTWTGRKRGYRHNLPDHGRELPADPLVAAADVMLRTNGRYPEMVKNRHGLTQLAW